MYRRWRGLIPTTSPTYIPVPHLFQAWLVRGPGCLTEYALGVFASPMVFHPPTSPHAALFEGPFKMVSDSFCGKDSNIPSTTVMTGEAWSARRYILCYFGNQFSVQSWEIGCKPTCLKVLSYCLPWEVFIRLLGHSFLVLSFVHSISGYHPFHQIWPSSNPSCPAGALSRDILILRAFSFFPGVCSRQERFGDVPTTKFRADKVERDPRSIPGKGRMDFIFGLWKYFSNIFQVRADAKLGLGGE